MCDFKVYKNRTICTKGEFVAGVTEHGVHDAIRQLEDAKIKVTYVAIRARLNGRGSQSTLAKFRKTYMRAISPAMSELIRDEVAKGIKEINAQNAFDERLTIVEAQCAEIKILKGELAALRESHDLRDEIDKNSKRAKEAAEHQKETQKNLSKQ